MTGSAGGVYGARRTVSLNKKKTGGKVRKGGDRTNELTESGRIKTNSEQIHAFSHHFGIDSKVDFGTYF